MAQNDDMQSLVVSVCVTICFCVAVIAMFWSEASIKKSPSKEEIRIEAIRLIDEELKRRAATPEATAAPSPTKSSVERIDSESERGIPSV